MTGELRPITKTPCAVDENIGFFRVFINVDVESSIEKHTHSDLSHEVCGILLGQPGRDETGWFLCVTASIEGRFAEQRGASVTFTHDTWEYFYEIMATKHEDLVIVGWYHSHPGFGVFYSSHDAFIQENFFGQPWQVGVVVDPCANQRGVFANYADRMEGVPRYWRIDAEKGSPVECEYRDRVATKDPEPMMTAEANNENAVLGSILAVLSRRIENAECQIRRLKTVNRVAGLAAILIIGCILWFERDLLAKEWASAPIATSLPQENNSSVSPRNDQ